MAKVSTEHRLRRILAMVPWIVANDGPTVEEVCARFACTASELADDISLLYLCGLHPYTPDMLIEAEISDGRVWVNYAEYFNRPLRLTASEALGLVAAASTLLSTPGTDPDGPLARGLAKLASAVGAAAAVDVALSPVATTTIESLRETASAGQQVEIDYYAFGRDERRWRTIEPAAVFTTGGHWYVSAYCHSARDERIFRIDRIVSLRTTGRPSSGPRASAEPALFLRGGVGGSSGTHSAGGGRGSDEEVVIELEPSAQWVVQQYPVEDATDLEDGRIRVRLAVTEWAWLDRLALRLGPSADIVESSPEWAGTSAAATRVLARYNETATP